MFIAIAIILTFHTLVDAGVYLIPYTFGTKNMLYLNSLNSLGTSHTPIFNIETSNSIFFWTVFGVC